MSINYKSYSKKKLNGSSSSRAITYLKLIKLLKIRITAYDFAFNGVEKRWQSSLKVTNIRKDNVDPLHVIQKVQLDLRNSLKEDVEIIALNPEIFFRKFR